MKVTTIIAYVLVLIGAIVWLLVGLFDFNLVAFIFGEGAGAVVSRIIYSLVGISALWLIFTWALTDRSQNKKAAYAAFFTAKRRFPSAAGASANNIRPRRWYR